MVFRLEGHRRRYQQRPLGDIFFEQQGVAAAAQPHADPVAANLFGFFVFVSFCCVILLFIQAANIGRCAAACGSSRGKHVLVFGCFIIILFVVVFCEGLEQNKRAKKAEKSQEKDLGILRRRQKVNVDRLLRSRAGDVVPGVPFPIFFTIHLAC